jgi:hypothetical protein
MYFVAMPVIATSGNKAVATSTLEENMQLLSKRPFLSYSWTTSNRMGKMGPQVHRISAQVTLAACLAGQMARSSKQILLYLWLSLSVEIFQNLRPTRGGGG